MNKGVAWTADEYEREVLDQYERLKPRAATNGEGSASAIVARPFAWPDPATIPPRQFLFGRHYVRKAIGATIGGGGRAKTTLGHLEAVSMACGRNLLTRECITPLRVWNINGEEDQDELDRRIAALCQLYEITEAECGDRLLVQSVRESPIRFATMVNSTPTLNRAVLDQFEAEIRARQIDVFMVDPLISFHSVPENDNRCMDLLLKEGFGGIASVPIAPARCSTIPVSRNPAKPKLRSRTRAARRPSSGRCAMRACSTS
jgi:hypothetical protein